jgi:hypothetical protein
MTLTESIVEDAALTWFGELGYAVGHGPQMAPSEAASERGNFLESCVGRAAAGAYGESQLSRSRVSHDRNVAAEAVEPRDFNQAYADMNYSF